MNFCQMPLYWTHLCSCTLMKHTRHCKIGGEIFDYIYSMYINSWIDWFCLFISQAFFTNCLFVDAYKPLIKCIFAKCLFILYIFVAVPKENIPCTAILGGKYWIVSVYNYLWYIIDEHGSYKTVYNILHNKYIKTLHDFTLIIL